MAKRGPYWCTAQVIVACTCGARFHGRSVAAAGEAGAGELAPMDCISHAGGMAWAAATRHVLLKHPARAKALDAVVDWGLSGEPMIDDPERGLSSAALRKAAKGVGLRQESNLCNHARNPYNVNLPDWPDSMKWSVPPEERPLVALGYAVGLYGKPPDMGSRKRGRLVKLSP